MPNDATPVATSPSSNGAADLAIPDVLVIGVGGCGGNIASALAAASTDQLRIVALNTDQQALHRTTTSARLLIGERLLGGRGAGADIDDGAAAARESAEEIAALIADAEVVFVLAGLGGGTGSGSAPEVCRAAREQGALAIAIAARPFTFEGPQRAATAASGEAALAREADALLCIDNDSLLQLGHTADVGEAFDTVNAQITEIVHSVRALLTGCGIVNLDIADLRRVAAQSGMALIRTGHGETALAAILDAIADGSGPAGDGGSAGAPLDLARLLAHFSAASLPPLPDVQQAVAAVCERAGVRDVFWGLTQDPSVENGVAVLLIGAGPTRETSEVRIVPAVPLPAGPAAAAMEPAAEAPPEELAEEPGSDLPEEVRRVPTAQLHNYLQREQGASRARQAPALKSAEAAGSAEAADGAGDREVPGNDGP